jgi:hypothetical protein
LSYERKLCIHLQDDCQAGHPSHLVKLLLTGLDEGNPGSTEWCVVYLVSRFLSSPETGLLTPALLAHGIIEPPGLRPHTDASR